jgi:hypothetical protein
MSAKRLAVLVVPVLILISSAVAQDSFHSMAQKNELSATAGRFFVSTNTVPGIAEIHFENPASFAIDYSRWLTTKGIFGISAELPVGVYPKMALNFPENAIPKQISSVFLTPSVRINAFVSDSVTPWVSVGGGYGWIHESSDYNFYGTRPGPKNVNTGAFQIGAGLNVWFWPTWGFKFEARDFNSGNPDFGVPVKAGRQNNYYVGAGVMHRF